tara:strand:- start:388 stop:921 length:534 start_codon:yes stop_codon:yes gene_type:complete
LNFLILSNSEETKIVEFLKKKGNVSWTNKKITLDYISKYDWIVSYGYRHIIDEQIISNSKNPILNLHISYLPYNRGAHPNYWSFKDNTPKGVTIHKIDRGIDTGPIFIQKKCYFSDDETLSSTYKKLKLEIEKLFIENFARIITGEIKPENQKDFGTFHKKSDLPDQIDWNLKINNI